MIIRALLITGTLWLAGPVLLAAAGAQDGRTLTSVADPHYTDRGFFDIHVCNWPGRPLFFMLIFSTYDYAELESVVVSGPGGELLGNIDLDGYRIIKNKGKPEKHAFITQVEIPAGFGDGWYTARATFSAGPQIIARDYVVVESMQQASGLIPAPGAEEVSPGVKLAWNPIPGAAHYQVFVFDAWQDNVIYRSKLLKQPHHPVPEGKLEAGGWYKWRVHARDVDGNVLLGDFNHGSLSAKQEFYTTGF